MFGKGKPSELHVKLAATPLKVDSAGGITSTTTAGPKSKTKGYNKRNSSSLLLIHVITVKDNEVFKHTVVVTT